MSKHLLRADSLIELVTSLREATGPDDPKERYEFSVVQSWAASTLFSDPFPTIGPFEFSRGQDPPDFLIKTPSAKMSIEVTSLTTAKFEVFSREHIDSGKKASMPPRASCEQPGVRLFTSTLREGKASKQFRSRLRSGKLPDDSMATPHAEALADLDADFLKIAIQVLSDKVRRLVDYRSNYSRRILLIYDKLSVFSSESERRRPLIRQILYDLESVASFEDVILVNGNHYPSDTAIRI